MLRSVGLLAAGLFLLLMSSPWGAESDDVAGGNGTLLLDDFDNASPHWYWDYHPGTGWCGVSGGYALLNISGASSKSYSDAEINDIMGGRGLGWLYNDLEIRLRCSDRNVGPGGGGTRGWGFWNGHFGSLMGEEEDADILWFISISNESLPSFSGFRAMAITSDDITLNKPLPDVDMTRWHTYRIEWNKDLARFLVDDVLLATTDHPPDSPMGIVVWIDNYYIYLEGGLRRGYLDLYGDHSIQVDSVKVSVGEGFEAAYLLCLLALAMTTVRGRPGERGRI